MRRLLLRADAGGRLGTGHVMRCLSLADAWRAVHGAEAGVQLLSASLPPALSVRAAKRGVGVHQFNAEPGSSNDAAMTAERLAGIIKGACCAWLVIDGYQFDERMQDACSSVGAHILQIDDYVHMKRYQSDLILNQNVYARDDMYPERSPGTTILAGCRYALLRKEFLSAAGRVHRVGRLPLVMIAMGGSDPNNHTLTVLRAIAASGVACKLHIVAGGDCPHVATLHRAIESLGLDAALDIDVSDMPALMATCNAAVCAGGTTVYELAFMGIPSLLVSIADNQERVVEGMAAKGAARSLGSIDHLSIDRIASQFKSFMADGRGRFLMSESAKALVDGRGGQRVVAAMEGCSLKMRAAENGDCELIWRWANDPEARARSFQSDPIPLEIHAGWYDDLLKRTDALLLIGENVDGHPVGQVRLQGKPEAIVSVSIDPHYRGRGLGEWLLRAAEPMARHRGFSILHAYIRPGNESSVTIFKRAGYVQGANTTVCGCPAQRYSRSLQS